MVPTIYELSRDFDQLAKDDARLTYSELHDIYGIKMPRDWKDSQFFRLIPQLDREDIAAHRPLRTAILVLKVKDKKTVPGNAHFLTYCQYQGIPFPKTAAEKRRVHAEELTALRKYYGDTPSSSGGQSNMPPPAHSAPPRNPEAVGRI